VSAVGVVGHEAADMVITTSGIERRPGGTPIYARRSLHELGVACVVVERGGFGSRLHHHDGILEQRVEAVGLPFAASDLLPAVAGCEWVILGGQTAGDFPPETIAALAEAGHRVALDGQGLCRGDAAGPVRLRPFPPEAIHGVSILKLNRAEAEAAAGSLDPGALAGLGAPEVAVTLGRDGALGIAAGRAPATHGRPRMSSGGQTASRPRTRPTPPPNTPTTSTCRVSGGTVSSNGIKILIAEDNALLRGVLRDALEEAGMDVVGEASDGAEAVVSAERAHPDVVVMDMRMPNVDGIEATEQIAAADWAMPVVVLSAYDEPQMIEAALNAGAASCLKKGVGLDELIDAIRAAHTAR
jgi:CheY-like chemotaxis protein